MDSPRRRERRIVKPKWEVERPVLAPPHGAAPPPDAPVARVVAKPQTPLSVEGGVFITNPNALLAALGEPIYELALSPVSASSPEEPSDDDEEDEAIISDDEVPERLSAEALMLLKENLPLADALADELSERLTVHLDEGLLRSAARQGLWRAAKNFEAGRGVSFAHYARYRVAGALLDELRAERISVRPQKQRKLSTPLRAMLAGCVRDGSPDELSEADAVWLTTWRVLLGVRALPVRGAVSLSGVVDDDLAPADELLAVVMPVRAAIMELDPVSRALIYGMYFEEATLEAAAPSISKSWSSRLHARTLRVLGERLIALGVGPEAGEAESPDEAAAEGEGDVS